MPIRSEIVEQFTKVAKEHNKSLVSLADEVPLLHTGLDSLCLATVVVRLEDALGFDPFSIDENTPVPVTFGDFVRLYEDAAEPSQAAMSASSFPDE